MRNIFIKKAMKPVVKAAKEVIVDELTDPNETAIKGEIVKSSDESLTKEESLKGVCLLLGFFALLALTRRPSVKIYVVK